MLLISSKLSVTVIDNLSTQLTNRKFRELYK